MTLRIMLYNPSTSMPIGRRSWAEIMDLIGDDSEALHGALEYFERGDGLGLSKLLASHHAGTAPRKDDISQ